MTTRRLLAAMALLTTARCASAPNVEVPPLTVSVVPPMATSVSEDASATTSAEVSATGPCISDPGGAEARHTNPAYGSCDAHSSYALRRRGDELLVCERKPGGCCQSVPYPAALKSVDAPMAVTNDGKILVVGRSTPVANSGAWNSKVEAYELSTSKRLLSVPALMLVHIDEVAMLGDRALIRKCVDAGPGCAAFLVDPRTGEMHDLGFNLYGVHHACQRIDDEHWAFVSLMDRSVTLMTTHDAKVEATIAFSVAPLAEGSFDAFVARPSDAEITITTSKPRNVVCVDLRKKNASCH